MDLWEENIGLIDDSDGCMGMLRDDLHQLHLEACTVARPDPVELAKRIAERTLASEWEMFYGSYETYRDIFGKAGCARYREIVEAKWKKLPTFGPGENDPSVYDRHFTLDRMMLSIAEGETDLDLVIRVMSRDLTAGYAYLQIAERCKKARKYKLALEWAEKGLAAFPESPDSRLRSFLADAYVRAKRPDAAMAMVWENFEARASLETYRELAKHAEKLACWPFWREKALALVRTGLKKRKAEFEREYGDQADSVPSRRYWTPQPPDHSVLIEILLWEKRDEEAWVEAQTGGCSERLLLELAKRREAEHPEDAAKIYQALVDPLIRHKNNSSYQEAVGFMNKVHGLMVKLGQEPEFVAWMQAIKAEHKRKRNFIKYVERRAWGDTE
jgi:uncharacterized Zn finger protein